MDENIRKTLVKIWLSEKKPSQVEYAGSVFRAVGSDPEDVKFYPLDTNALYGSTSFNHGGAK